MPVSQRVIAAVLSSQRGSSGGGAAPVAPTNTVAPVVSGTATVGQTLSCTTGTWTGDATIVFTYQWQRAGVNIGSATSSTYLLVDADYGSAIRCRVTGTNGAGNATANSNATAAVARTYAQEVLSDSPVGYWKLDEASGTTATDSSTSALNATYVNSPTLGSTAGPLTAGGTAATFSSGSSQHVLRSDNALLDTGDVQTLEAWVKRANSGTTHALFSRGQASGYIRINGSNLVEWLDSNVGLIATSTTPIGNNVWTHVVCTKNGATSKIYINAVDVTGAVTDHVLSDGANPSLAIGSDYPLGEYMTGSIAHAAIYGTALSAARVLAHYNAAALTYAQEVLADNPVAYYSFEEASGNFADSSGNGRTLTAVGTWSYRSAGLLNGNTGKSATVAEEWASTTYSPPNTSPFTIEMIVKVTSLPGTTQRVCSGGKTGSGGWACGVSSAGKWELTTFGVQDYDFTAGPTAGTAYHAVFVFDTSQDVTLYINGSLSETVTGTSEPSATTQKLWVATQSSGVADQFGGVIDELAVYNTALSAGRIAAHYAAL